MLKFRAPLWNLAVALLAVASTSPVFGDPVTPPVPPVDLTSSDLDVPEVKRDPAQQETRGSNQPPATVRADAAPPSPVAVQAKRAVASGDYDAGRELAKSLQVQEPSNPQGYQLAAMALAGQGDVEGARRELQTGRQIAPQDPGLIALEKLLPKEVGKKIDPKSLQAQLRALAGAPRADDVDRPENAPVLASPAAFGLAEAAWRAAPPPPGALAGQPVPKLDVSREGVLRLKLGDPSAAVRYLDAKVREDPKNWFAYRLRSLAKHKLRDFQGAKKDATEAIALNPRDVWSYLARAVAQVDLGLYPEAERDAQQALLINPKEAHAWRTRSLARQMQGRGEESLADLKQAAELDPQFAELYRQALGDGKALPQGPASGAWPLPRVELPLWSVYGAGGLLALLLLTQTALMFRRETVVVAAPVETPAPRRAVPANGLAVAAPRHDGPEGFQIMRKLGQGGMGEVFEARDMVLGRTVALKRLRQEIAGDSRERRRFLKEARAVASLKHPNILEIYSVVDGPQGLYLVFERVPGEPLHNVIETRGRLRLDEARELVRQTAMALDHAHGQGVIHRDLKPSNIMVADGSVKVMDFGIARLVLETISTLSRQEAAGTPQYMAPEQERGEAGPQSDVYALGVCLYELLSGRPPFPGEGSRERKLKRDFVPLCRAVPGLPIGLDRVLDRALDPEPERRYTLAGALAADLCRLA